MNKTKEFDNLYIASLSLLNDLSQFELMETKIYQKLQILKFLELKFHNLGFNRWNGKHTKGSISCWRILSLIDISAIFLYKALIKFYLEEFELAEKYAFEALDTLERNKDFDEQGNKKIEKISNIFSWNI